MLNIFWREGTGVSTAQGRSSIDLLREAYTAGRSSDQYLLMGALQAFFPVSQLLSIPAYYLFNVPKNIDVVSASSCVHVR
jgi:hypothetical protein